MTRCIGWRKHNRADYTIFYLDTLVKTGSESLEATLCYEPLERFIGISHKHWNNGKIMGDKSAIIPLDMRNGVILTSLSLPRRVEHPTSSLSLLLSSPQIHSHSNLANR